MVDRVMRMLPIVLRRLRVAGVASGKGHHATSFVHRGAGFARRRLERPEGDTGGWTVERRQARGRQAQQRHGRL